MTNRQKKMIGIASQHANGLYCVTVKNGQEGIGLRESADQLVALGLFRCIDKTTEREFKRGVCSTYTTRTYQLTSRVG